MSGLHFPVPLAQALIDSSVGTVLVQSFLSGLYTTLFFQTIGPLIKDKQKKTYTIVLITLYIVVMVNLATAWQISHSVVVVHDATRDAMAFQFLVDSSTAPGRTLNATASIAILIADALLVWRCYVVWDRNFGMIAVFSVLLLGETALIPVILTLNITLGPTKVPIICLFLFISIGITFLATFMIVYRIIIVSRHSSRIGGPRFQFTIEILVESGMLYSVTQLITGILLATQDGSRPPNLAHNEAAAYFGNILTPITGIAPTLICARIVSGKARDDKTWSQPLTWLGVQTRGSIRRHSTSHAVDDKNLAKDSNAETIIIKPDDVYIGGDTLLQRASITSSPGDIPSQECRKGFMAIGSARSSV